jgi:hypothetical protein
MKLIFGLLFILAFVFPTLAQNSNSYLKIEQTIVSGKVFNMLQNPLGVEEIGGDKQPIYNNYRDSKTTKQIPPTESQLEDRQYSNLAFETQARTSNNQYISVSFENLSGKKIKSVSINFILKENGKNVFQRKIDSQARLLPNGKIYVSESFFSSKNIGELSKNAEKEIIIENISFADGTKVKF